MMVSTSSICLLTIFTLVSSRSIVSNDPIFGQPEQIHLSYGRRSIRILSEILVYSRLFLAVDPSLMIVTWVTLNEVNDSVVEYGQMDSFDKRATGWVSIFQDSGPEKRREFIHRVVLQDLIPGQKYCKRRHRLSKSIHSLFFVVYHCGSDDFGWSPLYWFTAMRNDSEFVVRMAVYGDMGKDNAQSMAHLQEETQLGHFDLILHVGQCLCL
jgi:acid phosphatase type 7